MIVSIACVSLGLASYKCLTNSCDPLLAIVPKLSIISCLDIPIPESNIVKVLSFSLVVRLIYSPKSFAPRGLA